MNGAAYLTKIVGVIGFPKQLWPSLADLTHRVMDVYFTITFKLRSITNK